MAGQVHAQLHDKARLAALSDYLVLDTPPEPNFDDIVQLASPLCNAPISSVSLIETDRQWFKARIGPEGQETPIDQSVCKLGLSNATRSDVGAQGTQLVRSYNSRTIMVRVSTTAFCPKMFTPRMPHLKTQY